MLKGEYKQFEKSGISNNAKLATSIGKLYS